jgi:predicted negative regulator of RcsB-dependent stress response
MAAYDLEEQEKIDDLKAWWARWGNTITFTAAAVCIAIAGVQIWRWWTASRAADASVLYQAVSEAARRSDPAKGKDAMLQLADTFGSTAYAPRAALIHAKVLFDAGDKAGAKAQLGWVIEHADEQELKAIARYRLAGILLDEQQHDEALRTLDAKHPDSFNALYADLRGDILVAAGRAADARAAYQEALAAFAPTSGYRPYVQVKLDAAGGASPAPAAGGSAAAGTPSPGAAAK